MEEIRERRERKGEERRGKKTREEKVHTTSYTCVHDIFFKIFTQIP